jgi:hypothetical protein
LSSTFLGRFCHMCYPIFTYLDFATIFFLQNKVVSLEFNPPQGGPGLCIHVLQRQGGPILSPDTGFPFHRLYLWGCGVGILTLLHMRILLSSLVHNLVQFSPYQLLLKLIHNALAHQKLCTLSFNVNSLFFFYLFYSRHPYRYSFHSPEHFPCTTSPTADTFCPSSRFLLPPLSCPIQSL